MAHSRGEYCPWLFSATRAMGQGAYRVRMGLSTSEPASEGVAPPPRVSGLVPLAADMRRRERVAGCCCGGESPVSTTSP